MELVGRAVLPDRILPARIRVEDDRIVEVSADPAGEGGPFLAPGLIDLHVHGFGGNDAMGGPAAIGAMAEALLARGVTSFAPTAVSAPLPELATFAADVSACSAARHPGARIVGFNLEGPFLAAGRRGAHAAAHLRSPADLDPGELNPLLDGLRLVTIAPELDGAVELIARLSERGVVVCLGHSEATLDEARAGYRAGARSTTHLFNAMTGLDHRRPGLAAAALTDDDAAVELIADGHHVARALWPIAWRTKPDGGLVLVTDAIAAAGTGDGVGRIGGLEVLVRDGRATLAGTDTLAGSVIGLDEAVRNLVAAGAPLSLAVAAASRNPARLIDLGDRGEIAVGRLADLVELDDDLHVTRVWLGGRSL
jgi:N-acetylglucosamine-6-phosphate deacetylase